jgi:hypothetical protein
MSDDEGFVDVVGLNNLLSKALERVTPQNAK